MEIVDQIISFIKNLKTIITSAFEFLPVEIKSIFIVVVGIVIALYLYKLAR